MVRVHFESFIGLLYIIGLFVYYEAMKLDLTEDSS